MALRAYNPIDDLIIDFNSAMDRKSYVTAMTKLRALSRYAFAKEPKIRDEIIRWCDENWDYMLMYEVLVLDEPLADEIMISNEDNTKRRRITVNELRTKLIDLEAQLHDYQLLILHKLMPKDKLMGL